MGLHVENPLAKIIYLFIFVEGWRRGGSEAEIEIFFSY